MTTNANITIFNAKYDSVTRAERFYPTPISNVSYYESEAVNTNDGVWSDQSVYKIRVPLIGSEIGKDYIPEAEFYKSNTEGWSLRKGDFVILDTYDGEAESLSATEVKTYAASNGLKLITITEFADNTVRGSDAVKHWRIGGK